MNDPMTYVGPREGLEGQQALVRPSTQPGKVLAQFDDVGQRTVNELAGARDVTELEQLMFGWHEFAEDEFEALSDHETVILSRMQGLTGRPKVSTSLTGLHLTETEADG